jgi:hypothetical protein
MMKAEIVASLLFVASGLEVYLCISCFSAPDFVYQVFGYILAYTSVSTFLVALFQILDDLSIIGKTSDGSIPWRAYILLCPYLLAYKYNVFLRRIVVSSEPVVTKIHDGWYLAGWLDDVQHLRKAQSITGTSPSRKIAIVDLTCELPRQANGPEVAAYLNIPTWDAKAILSDGIRKAVNFAIMHRQNGCDIVVHCAFGHGRSTMILLASMVTFGIFKSWKEGETYIKSVRPRIGMSWDQKNGLDHWLLVSNKTTEQLRYPSAATMTRD